MKSTSTDDEYLLWILCSFRITFKMSVENPMWIKDPIKSTWIDHENLLWMQTPKVSTVNPMWIKDPIKSTEIDNTCLLCRLRTRSRGLQQIANFFSSFLHSLEVSTVDPMRIKDPIKSTEIDNTCLLWMECGWRTRSRGLTQSINLLWILCSLRLAFVFLLSLVHFRCLLWILCGFWFT